ncbi:dihydrolipoyl dehydrogenase family protein [Lichenicola sp.]|uniref:dihydrolipoyl dehydrogenase family protein n=1 Tax=Lichenicola sp. TaxID=2804529 RepID=UPI003AFFE855
MAATEHVDILILGGGKAGKTLAMDQTRAGRRVAVVEVGMIGGSCINIACIPSKALIRSAEIATLVDRSDEFGTLVDGSRLDMAQVAARTAGIVGGMVALNRKAFDASGFELVLGWGRFVEPRVIEVAQPGGTRRLTGERIYLNLGTRAAIPDLPGMAEALPLTHVEALQLNELPTRLVVMGAGYIGMELGHAFRALGSEVVMLDAGPRMAPREDDDVAAAIAGLFAADGIEVVGNARARSVAGVSGRGVAVTIGDGRVIEGSHLLVATGRVPMTSGIGLEIAGVARDDRGFITVDERLATSAADIWALGEAAGTPMFTHASLDDYRVARSVIAGGERTTTGRLIPSCLFIEPEFARVGINEQEAQRGGIPYRLARLSMDLVPRARTMSSRKGFMKCLVAADTDLILGFAMLGERAGEVMTTVQTAMLGLVPYTVLRDAILAHPTIAEGLNMLFAVVSPAAHDAH